ncbi:MAG: hypothetical protein IT237_02425 [Bacteroidia bacterium]|nr:hypothetical protein [Bacteroidia bacterium]
MCLIFKVNAQSYSSYSKGDSLMEIGKYEDAIKEYKTILTQENIRFKNTYYYNLACAYSLSNQIDSAISILNTISALTQSAEFIFDSDLNNLHNHKNWDVLKKKYMEYFFETNKNIKELNIAYNLSLMKEEGQAIRSRWNKNIKERELVYTQWAFIDSANTAKLVEIIEKIGWPDTSKVGRKGAYNAFLILQHSSLSIQKKYLDSLKKSVAENKASPIHLAYIEDRILQQDNMPQIYGTQIDISCGNPEPFPVVDPKNLNNRRKSIGLEPIEEYLKSFSPQLK